MVFPAVLVRAFWEQGKINEAVEAVNDMEQRGVVGAACVYYELACCLCNNGRWRDAMLQVRSCYMQYIYYTLICQSMHYALCRAIFVVNIYFMDLYFVHIEVWQGAKFNC